MNMPAFVKEDISSGTLLVTLRNNGDADAIEVQLATSGENAIKVAILMIASRSELRHGDTLTIREANRWLMGA
jgi:hypothetical protein